MPLSSWLIGSWPSMPAQSIAVTINANQETLVIASSDYYLEHHTASLSFLDALETALESHSEAPTVTVSLGRDRLVRITSSAAVAIDWTSDGSGAQSMVGATGNLASATDHEMGAVSPFLWVPDRPENPSARLGRTGDTVYDTVVSGSAGDESSQTIVATQFNVRTFNEFDFRYVPNEYFDTGSDTNNGGQYRAFFDTVVSQFRRFNLYRETIHDEADTTAVSLLSANRIGPYRYRPRGPIRFVNDREIANVEDLHRVRLPVIYDPDPS